MTHGPGSGWTADEMMTVAAARRLGDGEVCFVGIGLPSTAANLARRLHAPGLVLVYESGTIGAKPAHLPLSIGDGELAETADAVVPVARRRTQPPYRSEGSPRAPSACRSRCGSNSPTSMLSGRARSSFQERRSARCVSATMRRPSTST